jgi:hypothetical protein
VAVVTPAATAGQPNTVTNTRRLPQFLVDGPRRRWGRQSATADCAAAVLEWQPRLVDVNDTEIIRGGDGVLELRSLSLAVGTEAAAPSAGQPRPELTVSTIDPGLERRMV